MIKNRAWSFVIVTLVYILATAVGVVAYMLLPFDFWLNLLLADIAATVFTFIFSVIFKNFRHKHIASCPVVNERKKA